MSEIGRAGVVLPPQEQLELPDLVALAVEAERLGFGTVLTGEVAAADAFALLGAVAQATQRIRIGTGIIAIYTRSVALAAMGFASLDSLAPGRVIAGVGASSPTVVECWHGRRHEAPLRSMRSFVGGLRTALSGGRLELAEEPIVSRGFRLDFEARGPIPIMVAAMNPAMLRLAGAIGDAVELTWCPPSEVPGLVALVREGAERAGRGPEEVEILASFFAYAGDEAVEATERLRRLVLQYATVPTHRAAFGGALASLEAVDEAWQRGNRSRALELVSDEAVHALCAVGGGDDVARRIDELHDAGVDVPILLPVGARPRDRDGVALTVGRAAAALASRTTAG